MGKAKRVKECHEFQQNLFKNYKKDLVNGCDHGSTAHTRSLPPMERPS